LNKLTKHLNVSPVDDKCWGKCSVWGLSRTLLSNMVTGVTTGFVKSLEFNGVGYKAAVSGTTLNI
jgi:large subunit ribosomal protein L6